MRRRKRKKQRKIILASTVVLLCIMSAGYAAFQTNLNISAKGNIVEKSRTIKSYTRQSNEDFHSDYYRSKIVTANFRKTTEVPEHAVDSWDVSEKKDGGVIAWVVKSNTEGYYDLFIGAKDGVIANENSNFLFYNFQSLWRVSFDGNFNTENTTSMMYMFAGGNNMPSLDLSTINTKNVTTMYAMFSSWNDDLKTFGNHKLTEITFGNNFYTNNVTDMGDMFSGQPLKTLDLSKFDTSKVTNMFHMFNRTDLTELNLCSFNTKNVTNMKEMLMNMEKLTKVKVGPNWVVPSEHIQNLFAGSNISSVTTGEC